MEGFGQITLDSVPLQYGQRYVLSGPPHVTVETSITGEQQVFPLPAPGSMTVTVTGGEKQMSAEDARRVMRLWRDGTTFPAIFPRLDWDGSDLTHDTCVIEDAPQFKVSTRGQYATYSFAVTLLRSASSTT